jgi:hypothetical protein
VLHLGSAGSGQTVSTVQTSQGNFGSINVLIGKDSKNLTVRFLDLFIRKKDPRLLF